MKNEKGYIDFETIIGFLFILICFAGVAFMIVAFIGGFQLDFESGSRKITPTAVDNDAFGNYKVYYRTTEYSKNSEEDYYYIDKNNTDLAEQMRDYIKQGKEVIVYYDKYIGFKGFTAPSSSPIVKIEPIEEET